MVGQRFFFQEHPLKILGAANAPSAVVSAGDSTRAELHSEGRLEPCVPQCISFQAQKSPEAIAVSAENSSITYKELEISSNRFARHLQSLGAGFGAVVGLCLPRSIGFVVAALATMKAGGAYLPLDPSRPATRLTSLLDDAGANFLIVSEDSNLDRSDCHCLKVSIPVDGTSPGEPPDSTYHFEVRPENLAYVIYTSGSTGRPKGVEIEHHSLNNLIAWHRGVFHITSADRAGQVCGIEFDATVWELWPYLAAGASVHLADDFVAKDPAHLHDWLLAKEITIGFVPSPVAEQLMEFNWPSRTALRTLLTGADTLHRYPPAGLPFQVVNNYGPTECTVVATSGKLAASRSGQSLPPIGHPIDGVRLYILDEHLHPVERGAIGEIWIAGECLARGYRRAPALTAEKFLQNPFDWNPGSRMYRTGDLGRFLPDGQIAFLGRADNQIKIRGMRIEPAEIEAVFNEQSCVQHCAVVAQETGRGEKKIVAFVVKNPRYTELPELRALLANRLPEYMIPERIVEVADLPLTATGKTDHAALRKFKLTAASGGDGYVAPGNSVETKLAEILASLLEVDRISIEDNFFTLGGHSLLGAQFISRIRDTFGVSITLRFLFESPTISAIAEEIRRLRPFQETAEQAKP
jgi:amino acid adenylation domain-containing protein